jgi:hypothetical protein
MTIGRDAFSKAETITVAAIEQGVPLLVEPTPPKLRQSQNCTPNHRQETVLQAFHFAAPRSRSYSQHRVRAQNRLSI